MCTAKEVANYLLFVTSSICQDVTNMKINKLVYFAQGHALQQGFSLFKEKIRAGAHGPIIEEVYHTYEKWGDTPIKEWDEEKAKKLPNDIRMFLLDVAAKYSRYTASQLRTMTHEPDTPWRLCYSKKGRYQEIPNEIIADYFINKVAKLNNDELSDFSYVGYRDKEGYIVLPKDMQ